MTFRVGAAIHDFLRFGTYVLGADRYHVSSRSSLSNLKGGVRCSASSSGCGSGCLKLPRRIDGLVSSGSLGVTQLTASQFQRLVVRFGGRPGGAPSHTRNENGRQQSSESKPSDDDLLLASYRRTFGGSSRAKLRAQIPLLLIIGATAFGLAGFGARFRSPLLRGLCFVSALVAVGVAGWWATSI
jgi:hypothetical protein